MVPEQQVTAPTVNCKRKNMGEISKAKKKAVYQILRNIAQTGNPTCGQILFLQLFFGKKEKEIK